MAVGRSRGPDGKSYAGRAYWLKVIGFSSYRQYLKSDLWKRVRGLVFQVKGRDCYLCGGFASQAHHQRYHKNDLIGKKLMFIQPLCGRCHLAIEFDGESKMMMRESTHRFNVMRRARLKAMRANGEAVRGDPVEAVPLMRLVEPRLEAEQHAHLEAIRQNLRSPRPALPRLRRAHGGMALVPPRPADLPFSWWCSRCRNGFLAEGRCCTCARGREQARRWARASADDEAQRQQAALNRRRAVAEPQAVGAVLAGLVKKRP